MLSVKVLRNGPLLAKEAVSRAAVRSGYRSFTARAASSTSLQREWKGPLYISRRSGAEPAPSLFHARVGMGLLRSNRIRLFSSEAEDELQEGDIGTAELLGMMERKDLQLIDVREPEELKDTGVIPGAVNVPLGEVEDALRLSPEAFKQKYSGPKPTVGDQNIVFSCMRGIRSRTALESAHQLGYSNTKNYKPGWLGWEKHLEGLK